MSPRTPSYRLHRPSGQAVVTLNGRDFYLGRHDTQESRAEYDRLLAEWLAAGRQAAVASDVTISELMVGYLRHAYAYYVKNGEPTSEAGLIRLALRPLKRLYGHTPARDFGPLALKTLRDAYIGAGACRRDVNRYTGLIVRFFRWAVENERVPPSVHHGLRAVPGLRKGRTDVREAAPVKPVPDAFVDAIEAHVAPQVWAMVRLQRLTGMRPGEVTIMRARDLDTSGPIWAFVPGSHKTEHHDRKRVIYLGPQAQDVVGPWLEREPDGYLFSPREAMEALGEERRRSRRTPLTPSQRARVRVKHPKKAPGARYTPDSYREAIVKACAKAFPHPTISGIKRKERTVHQREELRAWDGQHAWHPNQLRHNAATRLRREFGLDVARVILGHSSPAVTEVYAEVDREKALKVMGEVG